MSFQNVPPSKKTLLLLDYLESHKSYVSFKYTLKDNMTFISLSLDKSHKIHRFNVSIYEPLKKYFESDFSMKKVYLDRIMNQFNLSWVHI